VQPQRPGFEDRWAAASGQLPPTGTERAMRLSTRLILLVLGCLLPVLTAQIYSQIALHGARKDQLGSIALRQAAMANDDLGALVRGVGQLATVLTQFPDVMAVQPGCGGRLNALHANLPQYVFLGLYDAEGALLCGSSGAPATWTPQDKPWLARVFEEKAAEAGSLSRLETTGSTFLPIGAGVVSSDMDGGRAILIAGLDTDWFARHLDGAQASYLRPVPHADLMIVERNGAIIGRLSGGPDNDLSSLPAWLKPLISRPVSGVETLTDPDGNVYLVAFVPMTAEPFGIATIETLAMPEVTADIDRATVHDVMVLAFAAATALGLAWIAGRRFIYAPTEALLQAAKRWRQGDLNARAEAGDPGSEFTALAQSFNAMAAGLQVREIERELQATALEARVEERTQALSDSNNRLQVEIAGREKTEAALHQAQKLQAVGQLAGGIAHDFNNMLATVLGNLELMERRFAQTDKSWTDTDRERMMRLVGRASGAVQRGSRLTSRLLAFSRRQQLSPRSTDINVLLGDVITLASSTLGSRIKITAQLDERLYAAMVDPSQVEAAMLNLCLNARDAMPEGGAVSIRSDNICSTTASQDDEEQRLQPGDYVRIRVSDTGCGMTQDVKARAFDPFFTTKGPAGTGLGLSQVYGMARQSGGDVTIQTKPGEGTQVSLYLPRAPETGDAVRGHPAEGLARTGAGELALLVDDDHEVRQVTAEMLRHLGFKVVEADSGERALGLIETLKPAPSLFLLDYAMPGMNGLQLAQLLRARGITAPIALVTGYAELSEDDLAAGSFCGVLHKPFTLQELQGLVVRHCRAIDAHRTEVVSNLV
jgi:signal transduction histidine kinase/CheY-like chemotaxis protein